jgi:two-component system response regulator AtoC
MARTLHPHSASSGPPPEPSKPTETASMQQRRILIVEDKEQERQLLKQFLDNPGLIVDTVGEGMEALERLDSRSYSMVITDLKMPRFSGMQLIEEVQKRGIPVTVIVTTGFGGIEEAVQAMRLGAYEFLTKPIDVERLRLVVQRALRERALLDEVAALRQQMRDKYSFHNILSKNPRMHQVFDLITHVANTTTTVLIEGETGTGKEQVARAIHIASSPMRSGPLVAVNCAAVPENLLESELFGHEKGSFTSAINQRRGRFELADTGTLFLDEVGDIPMAMQAKLLRVLQERRFERVGGSESIEVDVRVIGATNRSLLKLVHDGTFREDLYYRLNVVKIDLPPLRERQEDIPLLATHFTQKFVRPGEPPKHISPETMEVLLNYRWPGNVRELENAIERACVTCRGDSLQPADLPPEMLSPNPPKHPFVIDLDTPLPQLLRDISSDVEQQYIRTALKKSHGNIGRCARICGLSRRSISAKIAEYGIKKEVFKEA